MKIDSSLVTRRTFLRTLLGGWFFALLSGSTYTLFKFIFPTSGKEPDSVTLNAVDFCNIPVNSVKPFAWGGKPGLILKRKDGSLAALLGVCTHMECNITYRPNEQKFFCACHEGWFDENGKNIAGPPPKPLTIFDHRIEDGKLIVSRKD